MINAPHMLDSRTPEPIPLVNRATIGAAALAVGIFVLDVSTPLGVDAGVLYVIPLLVGAFSGPPRFVMVAAAATSALTIAGAWVSHGEPVGPALANRGIALVVIWTAAVVLGRFRRTSLALGRRSKDLADVNYALDQSAIIAITDTKGTIKYVNEKFCEISKYGRDELLGRDHRVLNSGYHSKEFIRNLWVTIANGRIWRGEIRNRAKDGSLYWVDTTIVPFLDLHAKPYQYMAIRYEITDRKRSEERLREQAALARLGEMAAVVAHEVKNPIAGIRGALQVIESRMPSEQRDRTVIGEVIARLDGLNTIVQDLLLYARPRTPKRELVDVASLVESTGELLRRDPALANMTLQVSGKADPVPADPEQLRIALQNLIVNAAQATGGQGTIEVTLAAGAGSLEVSVRDHGPGIPPEVREKAFEPFYTTKHRGTGLGLPIARGMIEAHGGHIAIAAADGGGTIVSIHLPARG
jgi:two-component system, sporulation sensor kinase A